MKTALITGSTGGIGAEVTDKLATQGYHLILRDLDGRPTQSTSYKI